MLSLGYIIYKQNFTTYLDFCIMATSNENASEDYSGNSRECESAPPDHGKGAWLFLVGCFWIEGLTWAFPFSYGVFEKYYSSHEPFASQSSGIAAVGTTTLGVIYFGAVITIAVLQRWPYLRRQSSILGLCVLITSFITSSFAQRVVHLIITQGVLYGVGGALLYSPFVFYLDEWFDKRKGLAYGFLWAGTGVGGTVVPLILEWGLANYGFRTMLRSWALLLVVTLSPLIYVVKPRLPVAAKGVIRPLNLGFLGEPVFWILQFGNMIQGLGVFIPSVYLPSYATSNGFSAVAATSIVSLMNCAQVVGTVIFGFLIDRFPMTTLMLLCSCGSATSVLILWGLATSHGYLWAFAFTYGLFTGGYTAMFTGCNREVQKRAYHAETGLLMGTWAAGRGIGSIVSGPVSERLLELKLWEGSSRFVYGTEYGILIVFIGITAIVGGLGVFVRFLRSPSSPPSEVTMIRD
ncbi:hypothetical protein JMJ35_006450 [Cladonia borealis]|uniref:Major facilitator superfamily (MFS) profile domain-containing protein n=1 Tax=Cladonia borealis TaxID=184061 RepID=A0AA39V0A8_9LECA|nr:hypothetical protein JMJ35_006450 [Cladonia borealis]